MDIIEVQHIDSERQILVDKVKSILSKQISNEEAQKEMSDKFGVEKYYHNLVLLLKDNILAFSFKNKILQLIFDNVKNRKGTTIEQVSTTIIELSSKLSGEHNLLKSYESMVAKYFSQFPFYGHLLCFQKINHYYKISMNGCSHFLLGIMKFKSNITNLPTTKIFYTLFSLLRNQTTDQGIYYLHKIINKALANINISIMVILPFFPCIFATSFSDKKQINSRSRSIRQQLFSNQQHARKWALKSLLLVINLMKYSQIKQNSSKRLRLEIMKEIVNACMQNYLEQNQKISILQLNCIFKIIQISGFALHHIFDIIQFKIVPHLLQIKYISLTSESFCRREFISDVENNIKISCLKIWNSIIKVRLVQQQNYLNYLVSYFQKLFTTELKDQISLGLILLKSYFSQQQNHINQAFVKIIEEHVLTYLFNSNTILRGQAIAVVRQICLPNLVGEVNFKKAAYECYLNAIESEGYSQFMAVLTLQKMIEKPGILKIINLDKLIQIILRMIDCSNKIITVFHSILRNNWILQQKKVEYLPILLSKCQSICLQKFRLLFQQNEVNHYKYQKLESAIYDMISLINSFFQDMKQQSIKLLEIKIDNFLNFLIQNQYPTCMHVSSFSILLGKHNIFSKNLQFIFHYLIIALNQNIAEEYLTFIDSKKDPSFFDQVKNGLNDGVVFNQQPEYYSYLLAYVQKCSKLIQNQQQLVQKLLLPIFNLFNKSPKYNQNFQIFLLVSLMSHSKIPIPHNYLQLLQNQLITLYNPTKNLDQFEIIYLTQMVGLFLKLSPNSYQIFVDNNIFNLSMQKIIIYIQKLGFLEIKHILNIVNMGMKIIIQKQYESHNLLISEVMNVNLALLEWALSQDYTQPNLQQFSQKYGINPNYYFDSISYDQFIQTQQFQTAKHLLNTFRNQRFAQFTTCFDILSETTQQNLTAIMEWNQN